MILKVFKTKEEYNIRFHLEFTKYATTIYEDSNWKNPRWNVLKCIQDNLMDANAGVSVQYLIGDLVCSSHTDFS